jgi:hypothetical protein
MDKVKFLFLLAIISTYQAFRYAIFVFFSQVVEA